MSVVDVLFTSLFEDLHAAQQAVKLALCAPTPLPGKSHDRSSSECVYTQNPCGLAAK